MFISLMQRGQSEKEKSHRETLRCVLLRGTPAIAVRGGFCDQYYLTIIRKNQASSSAMSEKNRYTEMRDREEKSA